MGSQDSTPKKMVVTEVQLVPWDPESNEHIERLIQQRIACGWNKDAVEASWIQLQRLGQKSMHWVVLSQSDPLKETFRKRHVAAYPSESCPISDTASTLGGKARKTPHIPPFIPLGHISLDSSVADQPGVLYDLPEAYRIANFYVSKALQGTGLGRAAMDVLEGMATSEPLCAKTLVLATVADEYPGRREKLKAMGRSEPTFSVAQWYARMGYVIYKTVEGAWTEVDKTGKGWPANAVCMKKDVI